MTEPFIDQEEKKTVKNEAVAKALENDVGYMWDLTKGSSTLKWNTEKVDVLPENVGHLLIAEPSIPYIGISVFPAVEGRLADRTERMIPVVSGHISPFGEHPLRAYEIRKKGRDSNTQQPTTIEKMLAEKLDGELNLKPETRVLDVMAFLPTHPRDYETNFAPIFYSPRISRDVANGTYALFTFVQDRALSRSMLLEEGHWTAVFDDADGANNAPYFKADSIAQLSAVEKLMLPYNKGRMVVVAVPMRRKPDIDSFMQSLHNRGVLFGFGDMLGSERSFDRSLKSLGAPKLGRDVPRYPSAGADDVDIKTGAESGARLQTVQVDYDSSRQPFIYHLRLVGITPEDACSIKQEQIAELYKAMSQHTS